MTPFRILRLALTALLALFAGAGVALAAPKSGRAVPPAPAAAPAPAQDTIPYENLHGYLGDRITVHTKYGTTRTGILARFTQTELALTIETPAGATEMTIPKDTIANMVPAPAPSTPAAH